MLGKIPPSENSYIWLRYLTAIVSVVDVFVLVFIIKKVTDDNKLSIVSGIVFTLMPWHIEQSRIYSPIMFVLLLLLLSYYLYLHLKQLWIRISLIAVIFAIVYFLDSLSWILKFQLTKTSFIFFFNNLFKLYSIEYLFYKNDSFWLGGFRTIGVMLPTVMPIFMVGLLLSIKKFHRKYLVHLGFISIITILALFNPLFPEEREFFIITPYLSIITGIGVINLFEYLKYTKNSIKLLIIA